MAKSGKDILKQIKDEEIRFVDFRFMDFIGTWQHFAVPISSVDEDTFTDGLGFDGSSIRGWQNIDESDMLVIPEPGTAFIDPFLQVPTLVLICNIQDPITRQDYGKDPRNVARKAEAYLKSSGIGDTAFFGPEAEFFVFDNVQYASSEEQAFYAVDSVEGHWNTGSDEGAELFGRRRRQDP